MLVAAALIAALLVTSCVETGVAKRPTYPARLTPEIQQRFNEADSLYRSRRYQEADAAFAQFIAAFEYNELTDLARFKRGEIRFDRKHYDQALAFYRTASSGTYNPAITTRAHYKAALSLYHLKRYGACIDEVSRIRREDASPSLRVRADSLGMIAGRKAQWTGKRLARFALFLVDDYIDLGVDTPALRELNVVSQKDAMEFVRHWVDDGTVTEDGIEKKPSGGYVLFKEALVKQRDGDFKGATRLLKKFTRAYPKNEYYARAKTLLTETSARAGRIGFKVGVILPLSGKYTIYGQSVLHGIECALGIYAPCEGPTNIQMVVKDSRGSPAAAAEAVAALAEEDVQAIVGPLLSATVLSAATQAQQRGIPVITLSQREGVASMGEYVFRNSVTSRSQVDSLVDYAARKRRLKRFFILYPNNRKGEEFRLLFAEAVRNANGSVVGAQTYNPQSQDLVSQVRGFHFMEDRVDLTQESGKRRFDALFLPGSSWTAAFVAPMLSMMGMENVQLLGTMRWNDPGLIERGGKHLDGAVFVVAFDKNSTDPLAHDFVQRFKKAYGKEPTLLEGLGYDSMRMILNTSSQGAHKRTMIREILSSLADFNGVTGRISVDAQGDIQRKLRVMRIKEGTAKAVE
jgi:ABC-type branched-subunit amino acid transport system substrate-binding protein